MENPAAIKGFSKYLITKEGYVLNAVTGLPRSPRLRENGYLQVVLIGDDTKPKAFKIHRLVAMTFVPPYGGDGLVVDHIDRDKTNNDFHNLRWITQADNLRNRLRRKKVIMSHNCMCACGHEVRRVHVWPYNA